MPETNQYIKEEIILNEEDSKNFFKILETPSNPTPALKKLMNETELFTESNKQKDI